MFNVADYFKKFSKIEQGTIALNDSIRAAFREVCGLGDVSFDVKKGVVVVRSNSIVRSVIFMKKKEVLEHLSRTSSVPISDIR